MTPSLMIPGQRFYWITATGEPVEAVYVKRWAAMWPIKAQNEFQIPAWEGQNGYEDTGIRTCGDGQFTRRSRPIPQQQPKDAHS